MVWKKHLRGLRPNSLKLGQNQLWWKRVVKPRVFRVRLWIYTLSTKISFKHCHNCKRITTQIRNQWTRQVKLNLTRKKDRFTYMNRLLHVILTYLDFWCQTTFSWRNLRVDWMNLNVNQLIHKIHIVHYCTSKLGIRFRIAQCVTLTWQVLTS